MFPSIFGPYYCMCLLTPFYGENIYAPQVGRYLSTGSFLAPYEDLLSISSSSTMTYAHPSFTAR